MDLVNYFDKEKGYQKKRKGAKLPEIKAKRLELLVQS